MHKAFINTHNVSKFQLSTSSGFGIISELITFQAKNYRFLCFFGSQFTITWSRIPKIGAQDAFNHCYVIIFSTIFITAKQIRKTLITVNKPAKFPYLYTAQLHHQSCFQPKQFFSEMQNHFVPNHCLQKRSQFWEVWHLRPLLHLHQIEVLDLAIAN